MKLGKNLVKFVAVYSVFFNAVVFISRAYNLQANGHLSILVVSPSGANVIKLFASVIYELSY